MKVLYLISDILSFFIYNILNYRKKVVRDNLQMAFPKKSNKEIRLIEKKFFRHLTDFFVESIKTFSITEKEIKNRMSYKNLDYLQNIVDTGQSITLVGSHQANWEWLLGIPIQLKNIKCHAAYTKIKNKTLEKLIKESRSKFGIIMYETKNTILNIHRNYKKGIQSLYLLLSDQSPLIRKTSYWSKFMGIKVPIHTGAEMLSKKYDMAYVFWTSKKIKRGYYEIEFKLITDKPRDFENYELTEKYLRLVEKNIEESPETYLWSHKRFKHRNRVPEEWR